MPVGSVGRRSRAVWLVTAGSAVAILVLVAGIVTVVADHGDARGDDGDTPAVPAAVASATPRPTSRPSATATAAPDHGAEASYVNEEYHFAIDGPGNARWLGDAETEQWDSSVYFNEFGGGNGLTIFVLVSRDTTLKNDGHAVKQLLAGNSARYARPDVALLDVTTGRVNGLRHVVVRSKQPDMTSDERLYVLDYWIPGEGYLYLVRGVAPVEDWPRVGGRAVEIMRTFECW